MIQGLNLSSTVASTPPQ